MKNTEKNTEKNTNDTSIVSVSVQQFAKYHNYNKIVPAHQLDFSDTQAVAKNGRLTAGAKVEGERVIAKYQELLKDFKAGIQIDLNNQTVNWLIKEGREDGEVLFRNPPVYSYVEAYDVYESVSSAQDATIPYAFFMLRYIQAGNARSLEPNFTITTDKSKKIAYDKLDVYKMFDYYKNGDLKVIEKNNKVSESVKTLFKHNSGQFELNVQNIYYHNADMCNYLKDVDAKLQVHTCVNSGGRGPEQILEILLCLEIFHSFTNSNLCPELKVIPQDDL